MAAPGSIRKKILRFLYGGDGNVATETKNVLLVAITIIAAATFQAGINPPGGVWQDTVRSTPAVVLAPSPSPASPTAGRRVPLSTDFDHEAGRAVMAGQPLPFSVFLFSNTIAFSWSIHLMLHLMADGPFFDPIFFATTGMVATYWAAIYQITPSMQHKYRFILFSMAYPYLLQCYILIRKKIWRRPEEEV